MNRAGSSAYVFATLTVVTCPHASSALSEAEFGYWDVLATFAIFGH